MGFKGRKQCMLIRCMKGPIRILVRARDLYFQNMSSNGVHVFSGGAMSCPAPQLGSLSRNTIVSSSNSNRSPSSSGYYRRSTPMIRRTPVVPAPRSHSVPIGRIDEDKCCHFGVDDEPEMVIRKVKIARLPEEALLRIDDFMMDDN